MIHPHDLNIFLDSGAFSAWTRGTEIDIDEYCEYIRANIEHLEVYASLDVIPGSPVKPATKNDRDSAASQSWKNYLYMKEQGLNPIPVYHYGEHFKWLDNMLEYGCEYIGIGGLVGLSTPIRKQWLDQVFTAITDQDGKPIVKTHGFGMTAIPLIFRYPWYSVDSIAWIRVAQNGGIYFPKTDKSKEFMFDTTPVALAVSKDSPAMKKEGKHYKSLGPASVEIVKKWLDFCGTCIDEVESNYHYRALVNATYFKMVAEKRKDSRFDRHSIKHSGLL